MNSGKLRNNIFIFVIIALFLSAIHFLVLLETGMSIKYSLADAFISQGFLAITIMALNNTLKYYLPGRKNEYLLLFWLIIFTLIWVNVSYNIVRFLHFDAEFKEMINKSLSLRFFWGLMVIGCAMLLQWVRRNNGEIAKWTQRDNELQQVAKNAELNDLKQQLQPHFLFNSLNSIYALTNKDPQKAKIMIQQLGDFLRGTLRRDSNKLVTLEDEMEHCRLYLDIEKVRFAERLQIEEDISENSLQCLLPSLILQPVFENAIKFGLYDVIETVHIKITSIYENNNLIIEIQNPFDPETADASKGTGFGIKSLQRRLFLIYGIPDLIKTMTENNLFITRILIPQNND